MKLQPKLRLALAVGFGLLSFATPPAGRDVITDIIWGPAGIGLAAFLLIGNWAVLPVAIPLSCCREISLRQFPPRLRPPWHR